MISHQVYLVSSGTRKSLAHKSTILLKNLFLEESRKANVKDGNATSSGNT